MYPIPTASSLPPPPRIEPILRPGASPWLAALAPTNDGISNRGAVALLGASVSLLVALGLLVVPGPGRIVGIVLVGAWVLATTVLGSLAIQATKRDLVAAPAYQYRGVAIEGPALDVLADIQRRFRWAEKMFGQVPTGIRWDEVDEQVDVLLWEAAGHAAKVSAIDVELSGLGYAADGSPQAALRRRLQRERRQLWQRLEDTQYEADDLAREASNTAAAARMALARSGSVLDLEVHTPSGADLVARGTLAAARARLALLAEVWAELDETTELTSERLGLDP